MGNIVLKILSLLVPLLLGYVLKKRKFFEPGDYRILAKITINITLPAAVIVSFSSFKMDFTLLSLAVIAFFSNWFPLLFTYVTTRSMKKDPKRRSLEMLCASGYNMGNFLIPFVQQFMGSGGVAIAAIFDSGNSFMCTGGIYIFTSSVVKADAKKTTIRDVLRKLMHSVPILTYVVMLVISLAGWTIPGFVTVIAQPTGAANAFVSMFMIGLMFEIRFNKKYVKAAVSVLWKKYVCAAILALIFYYLLPFEALVRQVLVLCAFAPVPSVAAVYTEEVKADVELASFVTSCSFLISCVILVVLAAVMGIT